MSFILKLQKTLIQETINKIINVKHYSSATGELIGNIFKEEKEEDNKIDENYVDPAKDRRNPVSVETSIRYLASDAYKTTYGDEPVWKLFRRNFKGQTPPPRTRKTCIRYGIISTGSPCPICRDEYLVFDHRNVDLVKQFISKYNGEILSYQITNICQVQHRQLLIAIHRAKNFGTITYDVPFRIYDYSDWNRPQEKSTEMTKN